MLGRKPQPEVARCPQTPAALVPAPLLERIQHIVERRRLHRERFLPVVMEEQAQRRQILARRQLETIAIRLQRVRRPHRVIHRRLVEPERDQRT